jgi:hypothetical protein
MLVLVTGLGNVGKSSFRRYLVRTLRAYRYTVLQADADGYSEARNPQDIDLVDITEVSSLCENTICVVEDVNALGQDPLLPLTRYDLIFYVSADWDTHLQFWIGRGWQWFKRGAYDYTPNTGFKGTRRKYDPRNAPGILRVIWGQISQRPVMHNDLIVLAVSGVQSTIVDARHSKRGPIFIEPLLGYFADSLRGT